MNHHLVSPSLSNSNLAEIESTLPAGDGEVIYQAGDQTITRFQVAGLDLIAKSDRLLRPLEPPPDHHAHFAHFSQVLASPGDPLPSLSS